MIMTMADAAYCLSEKSNGCTGCRFNKQEELDCRGEALRMGEKAINTIIKYDKDFKRIFLKEEESDA